MTDTVDPNKPMGWMQPGGKGRLIMGFLLAPSPFLAAAWVLGRIEACPSCWDYGTALGVAFLLLYPVGPLFTLPALKWLQKRGALTWRRVTGLAAGVGAGFVMLQVLPMTLLVLSHLNPWQTLADLANALGFGAGVGAVYGAGFWLVAYQRFSSR